MTALRHAAAFAASLLLSTIAAQASSTCPEEQSTPQLPTPEQVKEICEVYKNDVRTPHSFRLDVYEGKLNAYLGAMCHRNAAEGWVRDKSVRDAGPWIGTYANGAWSGQYYGTHSPVLIWYSKEMVAWLKENRPEDRPAPASEAPVPDGAMMIKEMYTAPGAACRDVNPDYLLPASDLDLPVRSGFGKHTLVGLNVYLLKMAWQFPDVLGIRKSDPMLTDTGIDSIPTAEGAMLDQAINRTAVVTVGDVRSENGKLSARVTVVSKVGHKFPSGVGFRRAFVQFSVLDVNNKVLWSSGRTDGAGVLIDEKGDPIAGELWWTKDCAQRIDPEKRIHQPHYQEITQQNQTQIYQELVATPPDIAAPVCGPTAKPEGRLTTSFLSICAKVKDNRILPSGFLKLEDRKEISKALGADDAMAEETGATAVDGDPDYERGGSDALIYRVPLAEIAGTPAAVQATLYYQPTPPFFLQDRFCTSASDDTKRLYYLTGKLSLAGTPAQDWKLRVVTSGPVTVP